jgi:DNA primase
VRDLVAQRLPVFEFAIRSELGKYNIDTNEGRLAALDAAAQIIGRIKDRGLRDRYAVSLDKWLGMLDEQFVLARVRAQAPVRGGGGQGRNGRENTRGPGQRGDAQRGSDGQRGGDGRWGEERQRPAQRDGAGEGGRPGLDQRNGPQQSAGAPEERYNPDDPLMQVEREALKLAVQRPALCGPAFDAIEESAFTASAHAAVYQLIARCGGAAGAGGGREWAARLREAAPDDRARAFVTQLAVEPLRVPRADGEADARYADAVLARVEELAVSRKIAVVKSRLQRLSPVDQPDYNRIFGDLVALEQRRKALLERAAGAL